MSDPVTYKLSLLRKRVMETVAVIVDKPYESGGFVMITRRVSIGINFHSVGVQLNNTNKDRWDVI